MKKQLLFLFCFICFAKLGFSQNEPPLIYIPQDTIDSIMALVKPEYKWLGTEGLMVSEEMKLKYRKPKGFSEVGTGECFEDNPRLRAAFNCIGHQLCAEDEQFKSFFFFSFFREDLAKSYRSSAKETIDKQFRSQMREIIKGFYGKQIGDSWADSITVLSVGEARKKWNADLALTFTLHLRPEDYYKGNFKNVKVLLIQNNARGYAYITSFYTDKAKKNFHKYWRRLEKTLRYED